MSDIGAALDRLVSAVLPDTRTMRLDSVDIPFSTRTLYTWRWFAHHCGADPHEGTVLWAARELLEPGDVVYDVGANVGYVGITLFRLLDAALELHFFEPHPRNFSALCENVRLHGVDGRRARNVAVSDGEREMAFDLARPRGSPVAAIKSEGSKRLATTTLDVYAETNPSPDLVKIDVEGHEPAVIRGARECIRQERPTILFETHQYRDKSEIEDLYAFLSEQYTTVRSCERASVFREPETEPITTAEDIQDAQYVLATEKTPDW